MAEQMNEQAPMKYGRTEAVTVALNGWGVGTLVRGHEQWADGVGVWTTWRITAIGDESVLVKSIRRDYTGADRPTDWREGMEHTATFHHRAWFEVSSAAIDPSRTRPGLLNPNADADE